MTRSGKTLSACDSLIDWVRSNPTGSVCIASHSKSHPFVVATAEYIRKTHPGVTVTFQRCDGEKDGVQDVRGHHVTDWPSDSA